MKINDIESISEIIRDFLEAHIEEDFEDDDDLFQTGLVNSLFSIELISFIEREFSIKIVVEDLDLKNFCSLEQITSFICRKKNG